MSQKLGWIVGLTFITSAFPQQSPLTFAPHAGDVLVVHYSEDETWDYPGEDMKGTLRTELTLRWGFQNAPKSGSVIGTAALDRVLYRGEGRKKGRDFKYDIEWTRERGYVKGADSEAIEKWLKAEIPEGVTLTFDTRGACDKGPC